MKKEIIVVENEKGCWNVMSHFIGRNGYPRMKVYGKTIEIYREMARTIFGDKIKNHVIMHTCDNRLCIKPEHLKLGTHKQNMKDMRLKKRARNKYTGKLDKK